MPKRVDHHARRTQIADALRRIAADRGLEAVTLRHVAAEAGVSPGMVQHYFRTKDEMMTFALEVVKDGAEARLAAVAVDLGDPPDPAALLRALLPQLLPLDEPRRVDGGVALAFLSYATVRPAVAAVLREDTAQMREFLAEQIRAAQAANPAAADVDPAHAATALLALAEGLGLYVLARQFTPQDALSALHAHLDLLLGPKVRPSGKALSG